MKIIPNQKIIKFSWDEIHNICKEFIKNNNKEFDCIVAITRGGLVPSVIISHLLDIRLVYPLQVYETESDVVNSFKKKPVFGENINFECLKNKKVLLVDDIYGSGATLDFVINDLSKHFAEIYSFVCVQNLDNYNPKYNLPNYVGEKVNGWVVFPWEEEKYER